MKKINKYIITGIMSIIPIALTYWIIQKLFIFFSVPGKSIINLFFSTDNISSDSNFLIQIVYILEYVVGFSLTILFLYFLGIIISNVLGKKLYIYFEYLLEKIPIVSKIYSTIKNITDSISKPNSQAFQKVVIIEYPRKELWTLAMVTGECKNDQNIDYYNLFVPTTPNPTSGYLILIKKTDVKETNLSVDDGLSIIISGGMVTPKDFTI
ncbi:MAG: hypothetical protein CMG09_03225 [Candidatus Marinimicrobia bacterium]|nr:hypothetical protein [Candidatus Neomarinimicrobiota bacterium]|tara:strand:+ start:2888 stop:3517 length:630 start_codon:yes stop_codon:yes gene_type:complete